MEAGEASTERRKEHSRELLQPPTGLESLLIVGDPARAEKKAAVQGPPKIFKVERSSLFSRLEGLLPRLAEADLELQRQLGSGSPAATSLSMEEVAEGEACIEMNLAVVPLPPLESSAKSDSSSCSEEESSDDDCSDNDDGSFPLKLPWDGEGGRRAAAIVMLEPDSTRSRLHHSNSL